MSNSGLPHTLFSSSSKSNLKTEWEELHRAKSLLRQDRGKLEYEKLRHDANIRQSKAHLKVDRDALEADKTALDARLRKENKELEQRWIELHEFESARRQPFVRGNHWYGSSSYRDGWEQDVEDEWTPDLVEDWYDDIYSSLDDPLYATFDRRTSGVRGGGPRYKRRRDKSSTSSPGSERQNNKRSQEREIAVKSAFEEYEKRWTQLSRNPTDPNVLYPTLNGSASELSQRKLTGDLDFESLPDEILKRFNVALFFLSAFGIRSRLSNDAGTFVLHIPPDAPDERVEKLRHQLKTEMTRWHTDKFKHRQTCDKASQSQKDEMEQEGKVVFQSISNLFQQCGQEMKRRGK
jgi:hypothetical protein